MQYPIRFSTWFISDKINKRKKYEIELLVAAREEDILFIRTTPYYIRKIYHQIYGFHQGNKMYETNRLVVDDIKLNEKIIGHGVGVF